MAEPPDSQDTSDLGRAVPGASPGPVDLDALLARRRSPARHAAGALAVLAALIVAGALIMHPQLPGTLFPPAAQVTPLPTPPPVPTTILSNVNYGVLQLNGQPLGVPPVHNVRLRVGRNVINLAVAPFNARSCVVVAPIATNGRGAVLNPGTTCEVTVNGGPEAQITVRLDLSNLSPSLQSGALAVAEQALPGIPAQTATVPAGQFYVTGRDASDLPLAQPATSALTVAVSLSVRAALGVPPSPYIAQCPTVLCAGPTDPGLMPTRNSWLVSVAVAIEWRFTNAAGAVVSSVAFPATSDALVALTYTPVSGWQLAPAQPPTGPLDLLASDVGDCDQGLAMLQGALSSATQLDSLELASGSARELLRGCRFHATYGSNSDGAAFIWRFGVLLAVDAAAHKLLPQLPIAPADEVAAVDG